MGGRLIHEVDLYTGIYGNCFFMILRPLNDTSDHQRYFRPCTKKKYALKTIGLNVEIDSLKFFGVKSPIFGQK